MVLTSIRSWYRSWQVKPTYDEDAYGWASSDPSCLRVQLLFLLRNAKVQFKAWENAEAAPEGESSFSLSQTDIKVVG